MMTYEQAAAFVDSTKQYGSILGLESIRNLMHLLNNVQEELKIIHVAGTNGKGSVCAFLSAALSRGGYRVGRFNSPAVFARREVFRIGEEPITREDYANVMERVKAACQKLVAEGKPHPTVFEVECAAAFLYFYEQSCDLVLLEVGMGGREDATNLISHPLCSVITSIDYDHMQFLGDSLGKIAEAKAGIIKEGCPVIALKQREEVNRIILNRAKEQQSSCTLVDAAECRLLHMSLDGLELEHPYYGKVFTKLSGGYQRENLALALAVLKELNQRIYPLERKEVCNGIAEAAWEGRFQVLMRKPLFVIDGAHNPAAVQRLKETVEKDFTNRRIIYIIGVLEDKERVPMLEGLLSGAGQVYTVTPHNPRALDGRILAKEAAEYARHVEYIPRIRDAVLAALEGAREEDVILAFGSLSYLGEVKQVLEEIKDG